MGQILTISLSELKAHLYDYRELAERGDIIYLTFHGRAKAALISVEDAKRIETLRSNAHITP